jgi:hypothetical protein
VVQRKYIQWSVISLQVQQLPLSIYEMANARHVTDKFRRPGVMKSLGHYVIAAAQDSLSRERSHPCRKPSPVQPRRLRARRPLLHLPVCGVAVARVRLRGAHRFAQLDNMCERVRQEGLRSARSCGVTARVSLARFHSCKTLVCKPNPSISALLMS